MPEINKEAIILDIEDGGVTPLSAVTSTLDKAQDIIDNNEELKERVDNPTVIETEEDNSVDLFSRGDDIDEKEEDNTEETVLEEEETNEEESDEISSEEDTDDEEGSEEEDDSDLNPYYYLAQKMIKDGELSEDFEVTKDLEGRDLFEAYKKELEQDALSEIQQKALSQLANAGYNAGDLQYAKLLRSGVDPSVLKDAANYENLSNFDIENSSDDKKTAIIKDMYKDKKYTSDEIEALVEKAVLDENLDKLAKNSKEYFKSKHESIMQQESLRAEQKQALRLQQEQSIIQRREQLIREGKVLNTDIPNPKDLKRALYDKTEVVEIQGKQYSVSPYELFKLGYDNNEDIKVWSFMQMLYKDENKQKVQNQAKAEAEEELFKGLQTDFEKKVSTKTKAVKKKINKTDRKNPFIFDGGSFKPV